MTLFYTIHVYFHHKYAETIKHQDLLSNFDIYYLAYNVKFFY